MHDIINETQAGIKHVEGCITDEEGGGREGGGGGERKLLI